MLAVRRSGRTVVVSILTTTILSADADSLAPSRGLSFRPPIQLRSTWFQQLRMLSGPRGFHPSLGRRTSFNRASSVRLGSRDGAPLTIT